MLAAVKGELKNRPKAYLVLGLALLLIVAGGLFYGFHRKSAAQLAGLSNQALIQGDEALALKNAKQALAKEPNNVDYIELVANLTKAQNPAAAQQYYVRAYETFKQQNNPDKPGQSVVIYWTAGEFAQAAGQTAQAKKYYQQVVQSADPSDGYEQSLKAQAQAAIGEIK